MYILTLTNKQTNEVHTYDNVIDINAGEKLYYRFQIDTLGLADGEYDLELTKDGILVGVNTLYVGDYETYSLQYKRGDNTFIDITLNAKLEDGDVEVNETTMTLTPSEDYDGFAKVEINATPLYDNAFSSGYSSGSTEGFNFGYSSGSTDGYNIGYNEGETAQKAKLTGITITENGIYSREDGYNEITVEVPDLNGSFDEGYDAGYDSGYTAGIDYASENAEEIAAANAIDLVATKFGTYYTKYSDNIVNPNPVTGIYPDGKTFYNLANIKNNVYNTGIIPNENTKLEIWFIPDEGDYTKGRSVVIKTNDDNTSSFFGIFHNTAGNQSYFANVGGDRVNFNLTNGVLYHIILSVADGLVINGEQIGTFSSSSNFSEPLYINGLSSDLNASADGDFGMIKITQDEITNVIIPTEDGLKNITTDEMLEVVYNKGIYNYINNNLDILDNLIKSVDVQPKVDVAETGSKFAHSTFTEVPDFYDFSNTTNMENMFRSTQLNTLKGIDFSKVQNMTYAFYGCLNLTNLDYFTPSKSLLYMNNTFDSCGSLRIIPNLDLSSVLEAHSLFESCYSIEEIGDINFENATSIGGFLKSGGDEHPIRKIGVLNVPNVDNMNDFFYYSFSPVIRQNLTEMGGFIGLKCNWNDGNGLDSCPNLTYQSCINILNGLADVTELGGRTLKVHQNFIDTVGDEISIGVNKGWTITA